MYNLCLFAGTTEGRMLSDFLREQKILSTVCVATEYGEMLIKPSRNIKVLNKRLSRDEMKDLFIKNKYDLVIDATHPYANEVTENIISASLETSVDYIRLLRDKSSASSECVYVTDIGEAVKFLDKTEGNILLTTGGKDISKFAEIKNFDKRLYARVLPCGESLSLCEKAGIKPSHTIAMQGPFSEELNIAMLKEVSAKYLVTKDGGANGGFTEKIKAAKKTGAKVVVIGRPKQEAGLPFSQVVYLLCEKFNLKYKQKVFVAGIGQGNLKNMTIEVNKAIDESDCLIGAKRMLKTINLSNKASFECVVPEKIAAFISSNRQFKTFTVLMSGDTGFYSGAKKLLPNLEMCEVCVLPGISSLSYFCSKLNKSYEDIKTVSLHGRDEDIVSYVKKYEKVFVLTGGDNSTQKLCQTLTDSGLGKVTAYIGERLSYKNENITVGTVEEFALKTFDKLSVVLIENELANNKFCFGLSDEEFIRNVENEKTVPMTKSEVRAVCLSKLELTEKAVCFDIGAGTGSVSVEMALAAKCGEVYAVEYKENALSLIEKNKEKFRLSNINIVKGIAPGALENLPAPTHAFIGGSSGNIKEIIKLLLTKNPNVKIVATAISLETIGELTCAMKEFSFDKTEIVSINVSRSKKTAQYNLMNAQNTVYIFTMQKESDKS